MRGEELPDNAPSKSELAEEGFEREFEREYQDFCELNKMDPSSDRSYAAFAQFLADIWER